MSSDGKCKNENNIGTTTPQRRNAATQIKLKFKRKVRENNMAIRSFGCCWWHFPVQWATHTHRADWIFRSFILIYLVVLFWKFEPVSASMPIISTATLQLVLSVCRVHNMQSETWIDAFAREMSIAPGHVCCVWMHFAGIAHWKLDDVRVRRLRTNTMCAVLVLYGWISYGHWTCTKQLIAMLNGINAQATTCYTHILWFNKIKWRVVAVFLVVAIDDVVVIVVAVVQI